MRFLHTSDWHLGKVFCERSLIEDQRFFLGQLLDRLSAGEREGRPYSSLIVSGDIYDKAVPSVPAVRLLSDFLCDLNKRNPALEVFFIAGNHDSPGRLSFGKEILSQKKIHIVGSNWNRVYTDPVVLDNGGEGVCVYALPYLYPRSVDSSDNKPLIKQESLYSEAVKNILARHKKEHPESGSILIAHLFTTNCKVGGSERNNIGTAEEVGGSIFRDFTYGAFGHIHRAQKVCNEGEMWYSGSPLSYDFGDADETYILDVTIEGGRAKVEKIPVMPLHKITTLKGNFWQFYGKDANEKLIKEHRNDYVRIISLGGDVPTGAMQLLKQNFPYILNFQTEEKESAGLSLTVEKRRKAIRSRSPKLIFERFLDDAYGAEDYVEKLKGGEREIFDKEEEKYLTYCEKGAL